MLCCDECQWKTLCHVVMSVSGELYVVMSASGELYVVL